nr:hypothetical protein [Candidatus Sigynarchaeota archaeon]
MKSLEVCLMLVFDPHVHTRFSDGTIFYNGLADLKCLIRRDGITAFTMTDHNTTRGLAHGRKACTALGIPFIPGIEISAKEGHLVAYGIERWEKPAYSLTLHEVLDVLAKENAVIVIAHPLDKRMGIKGLLFDPSVIRRIHGYEILNGASPKPNLDLLRTDRGALGGLCQYAGSDCHSHVLFFKFHVELRCDSGKLDNILEAMRDPHRVVPVGPVLDIPHWIADFPPAFTRRRALKALDRTNKQ